MPELHKFREDDAEINAAIAEAQRRYEELVAALLVDSLLPVGRKQIKDALVKARFHSPITGSTEHMWLHEVRLEGASIVGTLVNTPKEIPEVNEGDEVKVSPDRVSDWLYWGEDEKVVGGFVTRVLAARGLPW